MKDYLLLTDRNECPKCRKLAAPKQLPALCRWCGMHLFKSTDALLKFEEDTGWREYWVWTGFQEGWKHRTQVFSPAPNSRIPNIEKLPDNYGTEAFIQQKIADSRKELKEALKQKRRGPTVTAAKLP